MKERERAAVVELLRCAADERADGIGLNGMFDAAVWFGVRASLNYKAWDALMSVQSQDDEPRNVVGVVDERYRAEILEAAQRVEDKEWP